MDNRIFPNNKPTNPRRRKRSKLRIFKETYLPLIIAATVLLLLIVFIIASITRTVQRSKAKDQALADASIAAEEERERLTLEAQNICNQATILAASYDYDGAIELIDSFSGSIHDSPQLRRLYQQYTQAKSELVLWEDPSEIVNLSIQLLIADPDRAFSNTEYGSSFLKNYITISEFSRILQQIYENNYILIGMSDIADGTTLKPLYLPAGKKPIMLTQTQVNYYTYMTDGDSDKLPDKNGAGFASKLIIDANGNLSCEMISSDGETLTGAYDLVPILESFIATHPDFSFKGARATLAVTGYDGIFGYRIGKSAMERLSEEEFRKEVEGATHIVQALNDAGYTLACGSYENTGYGACSSERVKNDLAAWTRNITPILGEVNTLVYARNSDIANASTNYSGEKFQILQNFGFVYYLGFSTNGTPWFQTRETHIRQGQIIVNGNNLTSRSAWYSDIFDSSFVLDSSRDNYN